MNLESIQGEIRKAGLDGWLFFDHHERGPLGAVVAVSLAANAVMAQQAGAGKPRREFKGPVTVVLGELGVGGEKADKNMLDFRAGQAKIATCPALVLPLSGKRQVICPPSAMPRLDMHAHMDAKTQYEPCVAAMDPWGGNWYC